LKNLEAERCHGTVHHRPDRIADKERSSYSQFPNPHWESWSGEELATSAVGAPTSRCGSGGAIPNPRRKPTFVVAGLMYKQTMALTMIAVPGTILAQAGGDTVLKPAEMEKLFPASVYYHGQTATT